MPKKGIKNTYIVSGKTHKSFAEAAGIAVDLALETREEVAITEVSPDGVILGHINVEARGEPN